MAFAPRGQHPTLTTGDWNGPLNHVRVWLGILTVNHEPGGYLRKATYTGSAGYIPVASAAVDVKSG